MKRVVIFCAFLFAFCSLNAFGVDGALYYSGTVSPITSDQVIENDIHITGNTVLENNGVILGHIYFDGPFNLTIINHNSIESVFTMYDNATITQLISSTADINTIGNATGYTINVTNADGLDIADVLAISGNASEINIANSTIFIDEPHINFDIPIHLNNSVSFVVDGSRLGQTCVLLTNIQGNASGTETINVDSMYAATSDVVDGILKVTFERQTNYSIVFGGTFGEYLDSLRDADADDRFIRHLDRARDRNELNSIIAKSARVNSILLTKPLRTFNALNDVRIFNDSDMMANIKPFYIYSDEFSGWGGYVNISGNVYNNVFANIGIHGGRLNYDGELDTYNATLYGGNFDVSYTDKDFYVGTYGTMTYANFNDISVFNDDKIVENPHGFAGRFGLDSGMIFNIFDDIKFAPFLGGVVDYASILDNSDLDLHLRLGAETMVATIQDGNKYGVGLRTYIQTDGSIYAMLNSNMLSIADGVGGGINLGVLYSDSVISYKVALDIKFIF